MDSRKIAENKGADTQKNLLGNDSKSSSKRNIERLGIGRNILLILVPAAIIGPVIALFFALYFAAPELSFFLILAVLGILFYVFVEFLVFKTVGRRPNSKREADPTIRIKGRDYSLWGVLVAVSFCVLIAYYVLCGATMILDRVAHSEHTWTLFEAVCSSKVFWWITSICLFVFASSWAMREMEIKDALFGKPHSADGNLGVTLFPEPGQVLNLKSIRIFQVFSDGSALAFTSEKVPAQPVIDYKGPTVHLFADTNNPFYDDLVITVPGNKVVRQIGTYRYESKNGVKTVPIISIMDKQSDDC